MKLLNKIILLSFVIFLVFSVISKIYLFTSLSTNSNYRETKNVAVLLTKFDEPILVKLRLGLEDIQLKNKDKVNFTFYDSKNNVAILTELFDSALQSDFDLIIVTSVNLNKSIVENILSKAKQRNIPVIIIGAAQNVASSFSNYYDKVAFINTTSNEAGTIQGKIISNLWYNNKEIIDKNNDNILEYILLQGDINNSTAISRTQEVTSSLNDSGIKTKQLANINTYWNKDIAESSIENLFLIYSDKIEAIIANNDYLALGAIESLQKLGYNTGDTSKYIPVFGIDGTKEAIDLVDKNIMAGTVIEDSSPFPQAVYTIGMNLLNNLPLTENTNYTIANGLISIPLTYYEYISKTKIQGS